MSGKQIKWPDLGVYGVSLKRWMGTSETDAANEGERFALVVPDDAVISDDLKAALVKSGFEEAWIDDKEVMRRKGSFGSKDLTSIFPKVMKDGGFVHHVFASTKDLDAFRDTYAEFGSAPSLEEPVEEEGLDDADLEQMIGALAEGLEEQEADPAPEQVDEAPVEEVSAEPVAEEPVEEEVQPEPVEVAEEPVQDVKEEVEEAVEKDDVQVAEKAPEAPEEKEVPEVKEPDPVTAPAAPVELDGLFEGFEGYLIYQGIPVMAREEFLAALPRLVEFLDSKADESDLAQDAWTELQDPGQVRKLFQEGCTSADKAHAKTNIIDSLYPLAFDFANQQCTPEMREKMANFVEAHGEDMDAFTKWYEDYARECLVTAGKYDKSSNSKLLRGMRSWGARVALNMCVNNGREGDNHFRTNDIRCIAMEMKGGAIMGNTKQGFITPVRKRDGGPEMVIEKFEELILSLEAEPEAPKMTS